MFKKRMELQYITRKPLYISDIYKARNVTENNKT